MKLDHRTVQLVASIALTLAGLAAAPAAAALDVDMYVLLKVQLFQQAGTGSPVSASPQFGFLSFIQESAASRVNSATLRLPTGVVMTYGTDPGSSELKLDDSFGTKATLDAAYPAGIYVLTINAVTDGTKVINLTLPGDSYPPVPHISNFTAAQNVNATAAFTVTWDAFTGGTTSDFVMLEVEDTNGNVVFQTGGPGAPSSLNGTAVSATIPAGTLAAGQGYQATLRFVRGLPVNNTSYPGVSGSLGYDMETQFSLLTAGGIGRADVVFAGIIKGQRYFQSSPGAPVIDTQLPYRFTAFVQPAASNSVIVAGLDLPNGGASKNLTYQDGQYAAEDKLSSQATLDATDPDGAYALTVITAHDGVKTLKLNLTGAAYPPVPQIVNFAAAQAIPPDADFVLQWYPMAGGTASDYLRLEIEDVQGNTVFHSADPGQTGALSGTTTSIVLPRGTLSGGQSYDAHLTFARLAGTDTTSYPGVYNFAAYFRETKFPLGTSSGPDVNSMVLAKGQRYIQTSASAPVIESGTAYRLDTFIQPSGSNSVSGAAVTLPNNGATKPLSFQDGQFAFEDKLASQSALDTSYPDGTYTFTIITAHDGIKTLKLGLTGGAYPSTPQALNYAAAQTVDPNSDFVVQWSAFAGGTTNDFVSFELDDNAGNTVAHTGQPGQPDALTGLATSFLIPRGTLSPGQTYSARVLFAKMVGSDTADYPGVFSVAAYYRATAFSLTTTGMANSPVQFFVIQKWHAFNQSGTGTPVTASQNAFKFRAVAVATESNVVQSVTVQPPSGSPLILSPDSAQMNWGFFAATSNQTVLDTSYPSGSYSFDFGLANSAHKIVSVNSPTDNFPAAPHVQNAPAALTVDSSADFVLQWDPFQGGQGNDFILVEVFDPNNGQDYFLFGGYQGEFGGPLSASATSVVIPAGTLTPGMSLRARVHFVKVTNLDTTSWPGATGWASFWSATGIELDTTGQALGPDVLLGVVAKGALYIQTNTGPATLLDGSPYSLHASATLASSNAVTMASLQLPNSQIRTLNLMDSTFKFDDYLPTQAALDTVYPNGNYQLAFQTAHHGLQAPTLVVQGNDYPPIPHIANFAAAQAVSPTNDFVLQWDAIVSGASNVQLQVRIQDQVGNVAFVTPDVGQPGAMGAAATQVVIPRNTLAPGMVYYGNLLFARATSADTTTVPGAVFLGGYFRVTEFVLTTAGAPPPPVQLTGSAHQSDGTFNFLLEGPAPRSYRIDFSTDLNLWTQLLLTNVQTTPVLIIDPGSAAQPHRFYRAVIPTGP